MYKVDHRTVPLRPYNLAENTEPAYTYKPYRTRYGEATTAHDSYRTSLKINYSNLYTLAGWDGLDGHNLHKADRSQRVS